MNTSSLYPFTINQVPFAHFLQAVSPEEYQRVNQHLSSLLRLQPRGQSGIPNQRQPIPEFRPQTKKFESHKAVSREEEVEQLEKAEFTEESNRKSYDVQSELDCSRVGKKLFANQEAIVKFGGFGQFSDSTSRSEITFPQQKDVLEKLSMPTLPGSLNLSDYLRKELEQMLSFILHNMGKIDQTEIENKRSRYLNNKSLLQIYDKLVMKYFSAKRCREDIVRYILRRAFKEVRQVIMKEEKINTKQASLAVCKKYFESTFEELEKSGQEIENEEELFELLMPYTKKSKNRTMNTTFVHEVFASQKFGEDYQVFLGEFDKILVEDNNQKVEQFIEFLMNCIKKDTLNKIGTYKRFPWLDTWIQQTKDIAISLPKCNNYPRQIYKKVKR